MSNELAPLPAGMRRLQVEVPDLKLVYALIETDLEIGPFIEIDSPAMLEDALAIGGRLKTAIASLEEYRVAAVKPPNEMVRELNAGFKDRQAAIETIVEGIKLKCLGYNRLLEQKRRELEEVDRKKRADEATAELARAAELAAQASALQAQAVAAVGSDDEGAQALADQAMALADQSRQAEAEAAAITHTVTALPSSAGRFAKGTSEKWICDLTDKAKLIQHVGMLIAAGDLSLIGLLDFNQSAGNAKAKLEKEHMDVPGLFARSFGTLAMRRG